MKINYESGLVKLNVFQFYRDPGFKNALKGPDVTQKPCQYRSGCHTVDVNVCSMAIIKNPDCVDEYNIYYYDKLTGSLSTVSIIVYQLMKHELFNLY